MHIEVSQRCTAFFPGLKGAHRCAISHAVRTSTRPYLPLQAARLDGRVVQRIRAKSGVVYQSFECVSASSRRKSRRKTLADQTLPVTPEVVLIALPVLIVAIPWALGHLQLCLAVAAVLALSPFGTVIWSLVRPDSGRPSEQQQQRPWRSNSASRQGTDRPFWPVESPLLREPSLVVEADVLGPSDEIPQSRGNSSYKAQAMPQQPHSYRQSSPRSARNSISTPTDVSQRQGLRKYRRLGRERGLAQADVRDNADSAAAKVSKTVYAGKTMQQTARDFVAPLQPTAAGFWESESLSRGRTRPLFTRILRRVPFIGTWGGLL